VLHSLNEVRVELPSVVNSEDVESSSDNQMASGHKARQLPAPPFGQLFGDPLVFDKLRILFLGQEAYLKDSLLDLRNL
jgi:hypothetical protein